MVVASTLKYLANQRQKDAEVLFDQHRYSGAIYLMGYALELSLKRKVCQTIGFNRGFPELRSDFNAYANQVTIFTAATGVPLNQLRQIKNHDLNMLLTFSGVESVILGRYYNEWAIVRSWNPENRYKRQYLTEVKAKAFIDSAKKILKQMA